MSNDDKPQEEKFIIRRGGEEDVKTKNQVRNFVQLILQRSVNISTLIGSGASCAAIPLMSTTLKEYCKNRKATDNGKRLKEIQKEIGEENANDIELIFTKIEQKISGGAAEEERNKNLKKDLMKTFIRSIYNGYSEEKHHDSVLEDYVRVIHGLGRSRQILARQQRTTFDIVNLFTTNYDLFHEEALELSRYAYADGFSNGLDNIFSNREFHRRPIDLDDRFRDHLQPINPYFRLVKLHGSINWEKIEKNNKEFVHRVPVDFEKSIQALDDSNKSVSLDRVLIAPTKSKFALTQDMPYSDLFREFVNCLAVPNSVLFISGFGFGDSHISNLIESALDRTDFTLYVFAEDPSHSNGWVTDFFNKIKSSPNAYFVSPFNQDSSPLKFSDFAYFMQPSIDADSRQDLLEER